MGAYPGHSHSPFQYMGRNAVVRVTNGEFKWAVIDPVMSGGAVSPGDKTKWVPIKPTTDGALVYGNASVDY